MTTVADSPGRTARQTPLVEVIVGQELEGLGLQRLRLLLDDALTLHPAELVVDLAGSRRLDVRALHVLLDAHARALRTGAVLSLRSVSEAHVRSIALAGLRSVFHIVPTPDREVAGGAVTAAAQDRAALDADERARRREDTLARLEGARVARRRHGSARSGRESRRSAVQLRTVRSA